MRTMSSRAIATAAAAAVALSAFAVQPAAARSRGNDAAAAAAAVAIFGTIAAIIASQNHNDYAYGGGPGYRGGSMHRGPMHFHHQGNWNHNHR